MKNTKQERQYTGDFFATSNFEKKRQKAYLKGDKYFSFGKDTTGTPQMFRTCTTDGREEYPKTSTKIIVKRRYNNRKSTRGRKVMYINNSVRHV